MDYFLVRDGSVKLYRQVDDLDRDLSSLASLGYQVVKLPSSPGQHFKEKLSSSPLWDGYDYVWSGNLDALSDGLSDMTWPESHRMVVCIREFEKLWNDDAHFAHGILDVFSHFSRNALMHGWVILLLLQSQQDLKIESFGATHVV